MLLNPAPGASSGRQEMPWYQKLRREAVRTTPPSVQCGPPQGEWEGLQPDSGKPFFSSCSCSSCAAHQTPGRASSSWRRTESSQGCRCSCLLSDSPMLCCLPAWRWVRLPTAQLRLAFAHSARRWALTCLPVRAYTLRGTHPLTVRLTQPLPSRWTLKLHQPVV